MKYYTDYDWRETRDVIFTPRPICNGRRLKKGEQRPDPFWLDFVDVLLPFYNVVILNQLFKIKICGAYSRKYDKPRKFRKRRLF